MRCDTGTTTVSSKVMFWWNWFPSFKSIIKSWCNSYLHVWLSPQRVKLKNKLFSDLSRLFIIWDATSLEFHPIYYEHSYEETFARSSPQKNRPPIQPLHRRCITQEVLFLIHQGTNFVLRHICWALAFWAFVFGTIVSLAEIRMVVDLAPLYKTSSDKQIRGFCIPRHVTLSLAYGGGSFSMVHSDKTFELCKRDS